MPVTEDIAEPASADLVVACSGGGIRAAAFALGGLQRLRAAEFDSDDMTSDDLTNVYDESARVYGVSGGSYIATAFHLSRRCSLPAASSNPLLFAPDSAEADWLRRKSTYLLPSRKAWFRGLYSLFFGISVNVAMVGSAILLVAAYAAWLLQLSGHVPVGLHMEYARGAEWGLSSPLQNGQWLLWCIVLSAALGLGWLVIAKTISKYDRGDVPTLMWTTIGMSTALGLSTLVMLAPALLVTLHNNAVSNQPTRTAASVISTAGFVSGDVCRDAVGSSFLREARLAWLRASIESKAKSVPFEYGACGDSYRDDATAFPAAASGRPLQIICPTPGQATDEYRPLQPAYCRPSADITHGWGTGILGLLAVITTLTTLVRGMIAQSDKIVGSRASRLVGLVQQFVMPWVALLIVAVTAFVLALRSLLSLLGDPSSINAWTTWLPALTFVFLRVVSDSMTSSLQPFYRERLTETFFVKRTLKGGAGPDAQDVSVGPLSPGEDDVELSHWSSEPTGPALSVLCVANVQDVDYVPAQRAAVPFRFETAGPKQGAFIGITDARLPNMTPNDVPPAKYGRAADPRGRDTTLAVAVAASGAAFSPLVGRMSRRFRPYRVILTLANARLGIWLPNPYAVWVREPPTASTSWQVARRRFDKPASYRILREAFGRQTIYDQLLYITDGGHFDNTGMVEALRDRPRQLIVLDASADAADSLDALADAVTTARMDLNLRIEPSAGASHLDLVTPTATDDNPHPRPRRAWAHLIATDLDPSTGYECDIFFVKNVLSEGADLELDAYRRDHPEFPITTTVNQFYGEYDFEAYRQLGWRNVGLMLEAAPGLRPVPPPPDHGSLRVTLNIPDADDDI